VRSEPGRARHNVPSKPNPVSSISHDAGSGAGVAKLKLTLSTPYAKAPEDEMTMRSTEPFRTNVPCTAGVVTGIADCQCLGIDQVAVQVTRNCKGDGKTETQADIERNIVRWTGPLPYGISPAGAGKADEIVKHR
jgi:hypothetical protein